MELDGKLQEAKKDAERKLNALRDEMNKIRQFDEPSYEVVSDRGYRGLDYKLDAIDPQTGISYKDYVRVYVERVTKRWGSSYDVGKFYVRIETGIYNLEHKRNWTFESVDLPTKVHLKVVEIIEAGRAARQAQIDHQKAVDTGKKAVSKDFSGHIDNIYDGQGGLSIKLAKNVVVDAYKHRVELKRRLHSGTYQIEETPELSGDQMKRILAIIWEEKNEQNQE